MDLKGSTVIAIREAHEPAPRPGAFACREAGGGWRVHAGGRSWAASNPAPLHERGRLLADGLDGPVQIVDGPAEGAALRPGFLAYPAYRKGAHLVRAPDGADRLWSAAEPHPALGRLLLRKPGLLVGEGGAVPLVRLESRLTVTQYPDTQAFLKSTSLEDGEAVTGTLLGELSFGGADDVRLAFCPVNRPGRPLVALWPAPGGGVVGVVRKLADVDREARLEQELEGMALFAGQAGVAPHRVPGHRERLRELRALRPSVGRAAGGWRLSTDSAVLARHFRNLASSPSPDRPDGTPAPPT